MESPLQRSDAPPAGVAGQLELVQPTLASCEEVEPGVTLELVQPVSKPIKLCFDGFAPSLEIEIKLRQPDSTTLFETFSVEEGPPYWYWRMPPDIGYGRHTILVTQGSSQATVNLDVVPPPASDIVIAPDEGPPGTVFKVYVFGLDPHEAVTLYLYRSSDVFTVHYLNTLATVQADEQGTAIYQLQTLPGDPADQRYYIGTGGQWPRDKFYLTEP